MSTQLEAEPQVILQYQLLQLASTYDNHDRRRTGPQLSLSKGYPGLRKPLMQVGRQFCRTTHAFVRVHHLLAGSHRWERKEQLDDSPRAAHVVWSGQELLRIVPLFSQDMASFHESPKELTQLACYIQSGVNSVMREDLFRIERRILTWITPIGCTLNPPLDHKLKSNRGFNHPRTGALLCPAPLDWLTHEAVLREKGDLMDADKHWPKFLYKNYTFKEDDPWAGFLRSSLLVTAYKDIFRLANPGTSESEDIPLTNVTLPSIAYIATHVRHALSTSRCFAPLNNSSASTGKEFYFSLIDFFHECKGCHQLYKLQQWWNRQIFGA